MTCAIIAYVTDPIDPDDAHKMPAAMATEVLLDIIGSADLLQKSILYDGPLEQQQKIIEMAKAQFESYLDLMAEAARHVRALNN